MQQFGAFVFHTVVHWHKLDELENEYTLHNSIILAIFVPKFINVGGSLTKLWQETILTVFFQTCCVL